MGTQVFLWYKKRARKDYRTEKEFRQDRITDILLSEHVNDSQLIGAGYTHVGKINAGWFSKKAYLWVRKDPEDGNAITDIACTSGKARNRGDEMWAPPFHGFKRLEAPPALGAFSAAKGTAFLWYKKEDYTHEIEARNTNSNISS